MTRITQQQLESYLWGAAVLLRGTIDAGDYKQFIFPLLFFKRLCDVFDEETPLRCASRAGIKTLRCSRRTGEYRTLKLYGQERNLITSSISRMNLFLHGVEDFEIIRGDTLADPKHIEGDRLRQFDVILANPPYSIKQWNREAWSSDKWGRNSLGTPPQGRADYAFQQHILTSLTAKGRCAVLWPHGVLFRNEEQAMRAKMVEQDWVEAVIGLGPNLFYNSPMESCILVCNRKKTAARKGKVIFIDAVNEVTRERAQSFLTSAHQQHILAAYKTFVDVSGFVKVATLAEIGANAANLSIPLYVKRLATAIATDSNGDAVSLHSAWAQWQNDGRAFWQQMEALVETLDGAITEDVELV
jgi:type I restriction enzyme M protein